jgi:hypothetical protein
VRSRRDTAWPFANSAKESVLHLVKETKRLLQNGERDTRTSNKPHGRARQKVKCSQSITGCATKVQGVFTTTAVHFLKNAVVERWVDVQATQSPSVRVDEVKVRRDKVLRYRVRLLHNSWVHPLAS